MKKLLAFATLVSLLGSCQNEPKLNKQEESSVDHQLNHDQKAMDSLENAIKAQMDELDADSISPDSL